MIDDSDQRRRMTRATSELVVALVCTAASVAMMITSQRDLSPQALSGALGLCFGGMMLIRVAPVWSNCRRKREENGSDADP